MIQLLWIWLKLKLSPPVFRVDNAPFPLFKITCNCDSGMPVFLTDKSKSFKLFQQETIAPEKSEEHIYDTLFE